MVIAHGIWVGGMAVLLLARSGVITFVAHQPGSGIINSCWLAGYPKQQDYVWYALMVVAAVAGAWGNAALVAARRRRGRVPAPGRRTLGAAGILSALATVLVLANDGPLIAVGAACGLVAALLPWLDARWYEPAKCLVESPRVGGAGRWVGWGAGIAALSALWVFDSCHANRILDGLHEGMKLLSIQGFLAGDLPGVDVRTEYGPLAIHPLWWWMRAGGLTPLALRRLDLLAQAAGLAILLAIVRARCASVIAVAAGWWVILLASSVSVIQYGLPNALRLALPLGALGLVRPAGTTARAAVSGGLLAAAWLFSPEYGLAAIVAALAVWAEAVAAGRPWRGRAVAIWVAGMLGAAAVLLALMFRGRTLDALPGLFGGGLGTARLLGAAVLPLPVFPWWVSARLAWRDWSAVTGLAWIWGPGLLCAGSVAWCVGPSRGAPPGRRGELLGWAVFTLAAIVPMIARPAGQQVNVVPSTAILGALVLDSHLAGPHRRRVLAVTVALLAFLASGWSPRAYGLFLAKLTACPGGLAAGPPGAPPGGLERLAGMTGGLTDPAGVRSVVDLIRRRCPPGERVYCAAPGWAHLPFLADRAGLRPFLLANFAATAADRAVVLAALQQDRPPVALVTEAGLDGVPFAREHAAEWAWIRSRYRLERRVGDLLVFTARAAR